MIFQDPPPKLFATSTPLIITNPVFSPATPPLPGSTAHDGTRVWPQDLSTWTYFLRANQNLLVLGAAAVLAIVLLRRRI